LIDDPAFNGRDPQDAILTALELAPDLLSEPQVDVLARPYLLFCAEFDVAARSADPCADYLKDLWTRMPAEWSAILEHCEGFSPGGGADGFSAYVTARQVETTMPFNDYGVAAAPAGAPPIRAVLLLGGAAGVAAAIAAVLALGGLSLPSGLAGLLAGLVVAAGVSVWMIDRRGRRGAPWAAGQDLPTVLKALHVQAAFTRFAIAQQGAKPAELQAAFTAFLTAERPDDLAGPTQAAGVVPQIQGGA
jgi:hypothetical protein